MYILIVNTKSFSIPGFCKALTNLGHKYEVIDSDLQYDRVNPAKELVIMEAMVAKPFDAVFSFNYQPVIADACYQLHKKYICWVYDNPHIVLYSSTMLYPTNHVFLFDGAEYDKLHEGGVDTVYYMPLAADINTYGNLDYSQNIGKNEVSFVGKLYNEEHNFLDRYTEIPQYVKENLKEIMAAQQQEYSNYILEDALSDEIIDEIQKVVGYKNSPDGVETLRYVYANYFLARKLATEDRLRYLSELSKHCPVSLYTLEKTPELPLVQNKGIALYDKEMPYVFHNSRINLNIGLRSIKTGISLRCFDIMGCGGFLMTTCQPELFNYFVQGEDFECFTSPEDLIEKCRYYLEHEEKRAAIAESGFEKVKEFHSFEVRIKEMFDIVFN